MSDQSPRPGWIPPLEPHPDDETIELYVRGALSEETASSLEDHYLFCRQCQRRVTEQQEFARTARAVLSQLPMPPGRPPSSPFWNGLRGWFRGLAPVALPGMVALLVSIGAGYFWWNNTQNQDQLEISLTALRGTERATVPAGRSLHLKPDRTGLATVRSGSLVDASGNLIHHVKWRPEETLVFDVSQGLSPGRYWVRLFEESDPQAGSPPLREYGLEVR